MELIDQLSINSLSKRDLLLILKSLEFATENTKIEDFLTLRDSIVKEICFLTDTSEQQFMDYLENSQK